MPHKEKRFFLQALFLLSYCRLALKFKEFKEVVKHFNKQTEQRALPAEYVISPARIVALLEAAGKKVPFTTCLSKSLAGTVLLRNHGYSPVLHIGVAKENASMLEAHAWLSLDGKIISGNCQDLERYKELPYLFNDGRM